MPSFLCYMVLIPSDLIMNLYILRVKLSLQAAELYFLNKFMNCGLYTMKFCVAIEECSKSIHTEEKMSIVQQTKLNKENSI